MVDKWIVSAEKAADGVERVVTRRDAFLFLNLRGIPEMFGKGDFDDPAKLAEAGLVPVVVTPESDPYGYKQDEADPHTDQMVDGVVRRTRNFVEAWAKEELLENILREIKGRADAKLRRTDYHTFKEIEEAGYITPVAIKGYRRAVRQASNDMEAEVDPERPYGDLLAQSQGVFITQWPVEP